MSNRLGQIWGSYGDLFFWIRESGRLRLHDSQIPLALSLGWAHRAARSRQPSAGRLHGSARQEFISLHWHSAALRPGSMAPKRGRSGPSGKSGKSGARRAGSRKGEWASKVAQIRHQAFISGAASFYAHLRRRIVRDDHWDLLLYLEDMPAKVCKRSPSKSRLSMSKWGCACGRVAGARARQQDAHASTTLDSA